MKRTMFLIALLSLVSSILMGAITATYVPAEAIYFDLGSTISTPNTPLGTFSSGKLVGYLGTITITAVGEELRGPEFIGVGATNELKFFGPFDGYGNPNEMIITHFNIWMKTSLASTPRQVYLQTKTDINGYNNDLITQNPVVIDFFLVSAEPSAGYHLDAQYTLVWGSVGSFNIEVKDASWKRKFIPINNQSIPPGGGAPSTPTSVIPGNPPTIDVPYGEPEVIPEVSYDLNIVTDGAFALEQAYGFNQSVQVATAHMMVSNGEANKKYKVDIKFSNAENSPSFTLKGADTNHSYVIPYSLMFGGELVTGGGVKQWYTLDNGANQRTISVTGITRTTAEAAPEDTFKDTIYVEIIPVE